MRIPPLRLGSGELLLPGMPDSLASGTPHQQTPGRELGSSPRVRVSPRGGKSFDPHLPNNFKVVCPRIAHSRSQTTTASNPKLLPHCWNAEYAENAGNLNLPWTVLVDAYFCNPACRGMLWISSRFLDCQGKL